MSHQTAPVAVREALTRAVDTLETLPCLHHDFGEIAVLSTCNRVEFYAYVRAEHAPDTCGPLHTFIAELRGCTVEELTPYLYSYAGKDAVRHLCRVAAGLESLVLGEPQILGQVNAALLAMQDTRLAGPMLRALFQTAVRTGKRARTETGISRNPVSVSSVAVSRAVEVLGSLQARHAVVVGVGEMGRLALKALNRRGLRRLTLVNRTLEKARLLAESTGAEPAPLTDLPALLREADLIISATGTPDRILTRDMLSGTRPDDAPLVIVDIALPRNVDPDVATLPGVHFFDIDALRDVVESSLAQRRQEVPKVEALIEEAVNEFGRVLRRATVQPVIDGMQKRAEAIRRQEFERLLAMIGPVDETTEERLFRFSRALVKKLLHHPTMRLKDEALNGEAAPYAASLRYLFDLDEEMS